MKTWFINFYFQVYQPQGRAVSVREAKYSSRLDQLLVDSTFLGTLFRIAPAVTCYLQSLPLLTYGGVRPGVPQESWDDIGKFGILCLEVASYFSFHCVVSRPNLYFKNHIMQIAAVVYVPCYITVYSGMFVSHCMVLVLPDQHIKSIFLSFVSFNSASEYITMLMH